MLKQKKYIELVEKARSKKKNDGMRNNYRDKDDYGGRSGGGFSKEGTQYLLCDLLIEKY